MQRGALLSLSCSSLLVKGLQTCVETLCVDNSLNFVQIAQCAVCLKGEVQVKTSSRLAMARPQSAGELDAVALETSLLDAWKKENAFQQSIDSNRNGAPFIFLEGPPTANGKPGIHHVVARAYKDLVCRWKTMEGFRVERKGGWDTHGLPVEIEVQKRMDLMSNEAIEAYGMDNFNQACRDSVWTYESAWREMTERMAYWVDLDLSLIHI